MCIKGGCQALFESKNYKSETCVWIKNLWILSQKKQGTWLLLKNYSTLLWLFDLPRIFNFETLFTDPQLENFWLQKIILAILKFVHLGLSHYSMIQSYTFPVFGKLNWFSTKLIVCSCALLWSFSGQTLRRNECVFSTLVLSPF